MHTKIFSPSPEELSAFREGTGTLSIAQLSNGLPIVGHPDDLTPEERVRSIDLTSVAESNLMPVKLTSLLMLVHGFVVLNLIEDEHRRRYITAVPPSNDHFAIIEVTEMGQVLKSLLRAQEQAFALRASQQKKDGPTPVLIHGAFQDRSIN